MSVERRLSGNATKKRRLAMTVESAAGVSVQPRPPSGGLLAPCSRVDSRKGEEVGHPERPVPGWQGRLPAWLSCEVRVGVGLQEADEHLGDDPSADRPEMEPVGDDLGLLEDVVPKRCAAFEANAQRRELL